MKISFKNEKKTGIIKKRGKFKLDNFRVPFLIFLTNSTQASLCCTVYLLDTVAVATDLPHVFVCSNLVQVCFCCNSESSAVQVIIIFVVLTKSLFLRGSTQHNERHLLPKGPVGSRDMYVNESPHFPLPSYETERLLAI